MRCKGQDQAHSRCLINWVFLQLLIFSWGTPIHSSKPYSESPSSRKPSDISFPGSAGCFQPHAFLQPSPDPTALGVCVLACLCLPQTGGFLKAWAGMKLLWAPILWLGLKKRWQRIGVPGPGVVKAGIKSSHQRIEG